MAYQRRIEGGVWRISVDNSQESHKPVEISDLRLLTIQEARGDTESPTRSAKAAEGPLRGQERGD